MANIWEKAILILAGNLNSDRNYLITAVTLAKIGHLLSMTNNIVSFHFQSYLVNPVLAYVGIMHCVPRKSLGPSETLQNMLESSIYYTTYMWVCEESFCPGSLWQFLYDFVQKIGGLFAF